MKLYDMRDHIKFLLGNFWDKSKNKNNMVVRKNDIIFYISEKLNNKLYLVILKIKYLEINYNNYP